MKLAIEKISEDSEVQYFIRDKDYKWHISYDEMLSFLQSSLDAKLLRTADDLWTEAALLEIRGFQIKLVHDDLLGPYVAAVGKEPSVVSQ